MAELDPNGKAVKHARKWLKLLRAEARAREAYKNETEPRARERARKRWLSALKEFGALGRNPSDEALRLARSEEEQR